MSSPIPIRNLYYLLAYAWDQLAESNVVDVSRLDSKQLPDLFAAVLINGTHHLLRRGLDQAYISHDAELPGIRGRVNVAPTMRRMLTAHGRADCTFDELTVDSLPNRILRATIRRLASVGKLDPTLRRNLGLVERELSDVTPVELRAQLFREVQLHRNNRFYRFVLKICEFIVANTFVDEESGEAAFRDFVRDPKAMARLFERFVFNFYRRERPELEVRRKQIQWNATSTNDPGLEYLPRMETDIFLRDRPHTETMVIDTKFYESTFSLRFDRRRIHSGNLYQMFAYLQNLSFSDGPDADATGMLLYPVIDEKVRLRYELNDRRLSISTVNLAADWKEIRSELLDLISDFGCAKAA